ncbi:MAG: hypothetical protein LQ343_001177 [Gyalolechia ehrenbergii]|nr:MAG: hypothetical protein LQ343_001177 [Gyalolechia ehrenbergii]
MTSDEHTLLNHYNITSLYPTAWPTEKDESDASDDEQPTSKSTGLIHSRSKSRYSALARSTSDRRSLVPGSEKTGDGVENLVQKDEPDPLGGPDSVVRILRQKGLPVEEDQRLRNRFLLSSTTFSPTLYLSQVHSDASTQSLLRGLESLSKSIDQKSASLKVLVESNFERFVRAKTTIDNVYAQMRNQGAEPSEPERSRTRSRITSKGSGHFRNTSAQLPFSPRGVDKPLPNDKKKHALAKESEWGVQGIKAPLTEVAVKAEEIWGPALGGRAREETLRSALESLERNSGIFEAGSALAGCIKRKDYDGLVEEYRKARRYAEDARATANEASSSRTPLTDSQVFQIVITARVWSSVETQIDNFKRDTWRKLTNVEAPRPSAGQGASDEPVALIGVLLELGVEDNPIWFWLLSRYDYLKTKITASFERSRVEIEILRRRLANSDPPPSRTTVTHLKGPGDSVSYEKTQYLDNAAVLELWGLIHSSVRNLLSASGGLLGEIIEFWDKAQGFIDGKVQRKLPIGLDGQSRNHHHLSSDGVRDLQSGFVELVGILSESVFAFFADPPIEDVSILYSPLPSTTPNTPKSAVFAPFAHQDSRFKFDATNPPPPSPKRGEAWEGFAFWPPYSNALSGIYYLDQVMTLVGSAATDLAGLRPVSSSPKLQERLKALVTGARERCVSALAAAWIRDAETFSLMESWTRSSERRDITKLPGYFLAYERSILSGLQKIAFIPGVASKTGSSHLITPPASAIVTSVRGDFEKTIWSLLTDMVKDSENGPLSNDASSLQPMDATESLSGLTIDSGHTTGGHATNRDVRLLLTMSNVKYLQAEVIPQLINEYEINFSTSYADKGKTLKNVSQIEAKLFKSYISPSASKLSSVIYSGITSPTWVPATDRPAELRPYVYEALLLLVYVHTEISTNTPTLLPPIISYLFEQIVTAFLSAFRARTDRYSLAALMQATLDVEFVASILSQYTTAKASKLQSQVYQELDQRTDNSARMRLQNELPEMRAILKKLREGTRGEFACFKKQRVKG